MKRKLFIILAIILSSTYLYSQHWVGLSRATPAEPKITIKRSDNQQVSFSVEVSGFYSTLVAKAGVDFQRLSIPGCGATGTVGEPEIPVIIQHIAVPICEQINYSIQITGYQTLSNYRVYPVPELHPNSNGVLEKVFTINPLTYQQNSFTPVENYTIGETGALRSQHFVTLAIHPIQFNPATEQLQVATEIEITLTFVNSTTDVNVNVGIFNNVATNTLLNFEDTGIKASINDKAFEKPDFVQGNVQWMRFNDTMAVRNITADYLIICANLFFPAQKPHAEILRLANHRAHYNGFDIMILYVEDIISDITGFFYEGNPSNPYNWDKYKKEQRIRTCIRTIYETGNANNTGDGKLGYVLLVGDVDAGNSGMPSSFEQAFNYEYIGAHDYYFSCVTRENETYDEAGDLFIGRFCVPNYITLKDGLEKLSNMVTKTINYETEYTFKNWLNNVNIVYGASMNESWMDDDGYQEGLQSLLYAQNYEEVNVYDYLNSPEDYGPDAIDLIDRGSPYLGVFSHGEPDSWYVYPIDFDINVEYMIGHLNNANKMSLCVTHACNVGEMEHTTPCIAEVMTSYSPNKGFIAMIASSTPGTVSGAYSFKTDIGYLAPQAIFVNHSHIIGEIFLESRLNILQGQGIYNLFGDPALNIMAEGYEITQNITPECPAEITSKVIVRKGATLTVPDNCTLSFLPKGKLIIEENGKLTLGSGATIVGSPNAIDTAIHVKGGGFTIKNCNNAGAIFQNLSGGILLENAQSELNPNTYEDTKQYNLRNVAFENTPFLHRGTRLNISNCTFF